MYEIVKALNSEEQAQIVYTDEDKVTMDGKEYFDPILPKPGFQLDLQKQ